MNRELLHQNAVSRLHNSNYKHQYSHFLTASSHNDMYFICITDENFDDFIHTWKKVYRLLPLIWVPWFYSCHRTLWFGVAVLHCQKWLSNDYLWKSSFYSIQWQWCLFGRRIQRFCIYTSFSKDKPFIKRAFSALGIVCITAERIGLFPIAINPCPFQDKFSFLVLLKFFICRFIFPSYILIAANAINICNYVHSCCHYPFFVLPNGYIHYGVE